MRVVGPKIGKILPKCFGFELPVHIRQRNHLVARGFNGAGFVAVDVSRIHTDRTLMRLQNGGDYDLVGLRAARDEVDAGVRRSDRLFNEFGGAGAVSVHPVTHGLFKVGFNKRFDNLGMCAFGVVALEVDHIFILGKPEILLLFSFSPQEAKERGREAFWQKKKRLRLK
jgi:hypothetical protein